MICNLFISGGKLPLGFWIQDKKDFMPLLVEIICILLVGSLLSEQMTRLQLLSLGVWDDGASAHETTPVSQGPSCTNFTLRFPFFLYLHFVPHLPAVKGYAQKLNENVHFGSLLLAELFAYGDCLEVKLPWNNKQGLYSWLWAERSLIGSFCSFPCEAENSPLQSEIVCSEWSVSSHLFLPLC